MRLLIVYHSQSGNTAKLAQAALAGAREFSETETILQRAFDTSAEDVAAADGLLLGTPENFGYMSGGLKDFFDRSYYPLEGKLCNMPYGIFISCGNDGRGAVREIQRIAKGYPLKQVAEPYIARGKVEEQHLQACHELGQTLAAGLAFGAF